MTGMHREIDMNNQPDLFSTAYLDHARQTILRWLERDFLELIEESEVLPQVVANLPGNMARGNAMKIKELRALNLQELKLLSFHLSRVTVDINVNLHVGIDVSWDEYQSSQEVREFVGEAEDEFISTTVFFDSPVQVTLELELLKEPPMVASCKLRKISGDATYVEYKS